LTPRSRRTRSCSISTINYKPAKTCEEFIRDYLPGELFYNFIVGPYGSGKTSANLMKLVYMASLQAPSEIDGIRRTRAVIVRNTGNQLSDTTIPSWNLWFKDGVAGQWKATLKTFVLRFGDVECEVLFRPLDTPDDVSRVLSLEVTFAILDEFVEIPAAIREALSGRCGRYPSKNDGGAGATNWGMWGASNPGDEDNEWFKYLAIEHPEERAENVKYYHQPSGLADDAENLANLPGGRGYYANLAKGKTPAWVKQFIEAEWGYSIAGKPVISTFNREMHVSKVPLRFDPYLPLVAGYDPGMHSAFIFGQQDLYGRLHILAELILEGYGAERAIDDRLLPLLKAKFPNAQFTIAPDPAANSRTPTNESTVIDVLRRFKYKKYWDVVVDDTNLLQPRLSAIEHFTTRLTEKGPALVIDPSCRAIIRALVSGWRWEQTKKDTEKTTPEKNIHSHPGDACGYLCRHFHRGAVKKGRRTEANQRPVLPTFTNPYVLR
jgi:hypothetical protein